MQVSNQDIAARAYQLWEEEGRPHGRDLDHWTKAASELGKNGNGNGSVNGAALTAAPKPVKKATTSKPKATVEPIAPVAAKAKKPAKSKK